MLSPSEIILKLFLAAIVGGVIGFERQTHGRAAGFRTQLLVCLASALLMIIAENYYTQGSLSPNVIRIDPTRIAAGAMTGVGFLGAGVIVKTGVTVQGLTTAACIWIVSAIGLSIGAGQYLAAISGSALTFLTLWTLRIFESKMPRLVFKNITVVTDETGDEDGLVSVFLKSGLSIVKTDYEIHLHEKKKTFIFTVSASDRVSPKEIIDGLSAIGSVKRIDIKG